MTAEVSAVYCRMVLGSCSEYFRTRVTSWDDDPHTLRGKDGRPVLVVAVEPELTEAAQAVVRLMYDGVVAKGMGPQQLAQVSI
jgi:L-asparaginase/Glu-tRNA(Gln) amidotransferase subunit D